VANTASTIKRPVALGVALDRVDGRAKVTGSASYTGDISPDGAAYAVLVQSTIARGSISKIDSSKAESLEGVLAIFSHQNPPHPPKQTRKGKAKPGSAGEFFLEDNKIFYHGQIIAMVVADSLELAQHAASLISIKYRRLQAETIMDSRRKSLKNAESEGNGRRGNTKEALSKASIKIKATYTTPTESHNPMEPFATTAVWEADALTLYDSTQAVTNTRKKVAAALGISDTRVRVISHFVGGGFGCKLSSWSHVALTAMAARKIQRPVKLTMARSQMFGPVGFRPSTLQTITLGAQKNGKLTAIKHETISETSKFTDFVEAASAVSLNSYTCKNVITSQRIAPLDIGHPTWMRAPGHACGSFALESALDELACELKMNPLALRLKNFAEKDPSSGLPWSSNALKKCYQSGAERFGWHQRKAKTGSFKRDGLLIGMGMATAMHSVWRNSSSALVRIMADGTALAQAGTQEIGTGTKTIMSQIAAERLGLPPDAVKFELGDSDLPVAPLSGGSTTTGSVGPAVAAAADKALQKLINLAVNDKQSPLYGVSGETIYAEEGYLKIGGATKKDAFTAILARAACKFVEGQSEHKPGDEEEHYSLSTFGAQFVEVAVDPLLSTIRVVRATGAFSGGRIINAKTARSQMTGGIIFGIGMALMEQTVMDPSTDHYVNNNLGEYYVPVNADCPAIDAFFVEDEDHHVNTLGVKGIGELGITGVAAAIANAVFNATGKRVRDLPITLDKLI